MSRQETSASNQDHDSLRWMAKLEAYMADEAFGSPRAKALNNLLEIGYVTDEIEMWREQRKIGKPASVRAQAESALRIAEYEAALLHHQFRTRLDTIPGYATAYFELETLTGNLLSAYTEDEQSQNPTYTKEQARGYAKDYLHEDMGRILREISEKNDNAF